MTPPTNLASDCSYVSRNMVQPRVSYSGDNFASMLSDFNKCFSREMPNSNSCDEFSERLQIVLFTQGDPELNAVYNATADA